MPPVLSLHEDRLGHRAVPLERSHLRGGDGPLPDFPGDGAFGFGGCGERHEAPALDHGEAGAEHRHILHDVRGENDDAVLRQLREEPVEAQALLGVQPRRGLIHNDEPEVPGDGLGQPQPLAHAA